MTQVALPTMVSDLPVSDLDGLTVWHEARLEEDIENIPNMATSDLVELLLNTRLPAERIVDWTDQAILYTQLGCDENGKSPARRTLREYGIRTATGLLCAADAAERAGHADAFARILPSDNGASVLPSLRSALEADSNLALIRRWREIP